MKSTKNVRVILIIALAFYFMILAGCNDNAMTAQSDEKMTVAVTILPQKAFVNAVCGDLADVVVIVPPGNSPGNYEPTPQEMENFSKSLIYFTIGVPTEKANILPEAQDMKIIDTPTRVSEVYPDRKFNGGNRDPHIWLSPKRAKVMVEIIAEEMSELDVSNAQTYKKNAENFIKELDLLDNEIKTILDKMENKKFIVYHPAYGYFADDYGLEMYSLEENGKEATAQQLQKMIDLAKTENITTIFSQAEIDSQQPNAFAEEIGGKKVMLEPLSEDYIANLRNMANAIAGSGK